jgi:hypothetical protein
LYIEIDQDQFKDKEKIIAQVRNRTNMFNQENEHFDHVEDNPDLPEFLLKHKKKYAYLLDHDPPNANFQDYIVEEERGR